MNNTTATIQISTHETITVAPHQLSSTVERAKPEDPHGAEYNAAVDAAERLLLALASEGIDMNDERVQRAARTTFEALGNEFGL